MKTIFSEQRFPEDISYGSKGGPFYSTDIATLVSGHEQRNINWQSARNIYNVSEGIKSEEQMHELLNFFHAMRGRAIGFRYKDWADYKASSQKIAVADGLCDSFQLIKTYSLEKLEVFRTITKPVINTVNIFINDVETLDFTINHTTGIVTLPQPPSKDSIITADFEFDVPVRFDTDNLNSTIENYETFIAGEIPLIEIRV